MPKVSKFTSARDNAPADCDLDKWLEQTINPPKDLKEKVESYRETGNVFSKALLPCITISARFKKVRNLKNIKNKTGFICLDIDREAKSKKNSCNLCADMGKVKELFASFKYTYYAGFSTGGDGVYAIIKIDKKKKLIHFFELLKKRLARVGLNIDESCKDYTRLRFFSYDKDAYFNPKAKTMKLPKKKKRKKNNHTGVAKKGDEEKVRAVISQIEKHSIDITSDYRDWIKIAASLYNSFGEGGRQYFHKVSRFHTDYRPNKADKKFEQCMKMKSVNLSSFFYIANSYGMRY